MSEKITVNYMLNAIDDYYEKMGKEPSHFLITPSQWKTLEEEMMSNTVPYKNEEERQEFKLAKTKKSPEAPEQSELVGLIAGVQIIVDNRQNLYLSKQDVSRIGYSQRWEK